jgi:chromate transporter
MWLFLKLGAIGFGGPAVTIAMMEDEIVTRRKWLTEEYFLDLIGFTNLIPGPNAAEIAIHVGLLRAGWLGFILAGAGFIIPAALTTLAFAWAYLRFGALPQVAPLLQGIKPAVLAVIVAALWRLGKTAVKGWKLAILALGVLGASLLGVNEIVVLFAGGILGAVWLRASDLKRLFSRRDGTGKLGLFGPGFWLSKSAMTLRAGGLVFGQVLKALVGPSVSDLFWFFFLRVGAVLYGSGYVLVALLQGGLVRDLHWLSQQQLLDAIAAGQVTPGPLLSTATFIGYLLRGVPGATVATVAVFLPSFIFVAASSSLVPRFRRSPWAAAFLDSVNVCSLGLMAAVAIELGLVTLRSWPAILIALVAAVLGLRWKVNSAWLVLAGALAGWLLTLVH